MAVLIGELRLRREDEAFGAPACELAPAPSPAEEGAGGGPLWPSETAFGVWPCNWPAVEDDSGQGVMRFPPRADLTG